MKETSNLHTRSNPNNDQAEWIHKIEGNVLAVGKVEKYGCLTLLYTTNQTKVANRLR